MALMLKGMIRMSQPHGFRHLVGCSYRGGDSKSTRAAWQGSHRCREQSVLEICLGQRRNAMLPGRVLEVMMQPS